MSQIRFKKPDGSDYPKWEKVIFGDEFSEVNEKTSDNDKYPLYSLTIEEGVTEKTDRYERSYLVKKDGDNYKIVPKNAFVYNPMNLRFGALAVNHSGKEVSVSQYYNVFTVKNEATIPFWENYLVSKPMLDFYFSIATGSLVEKLRVHYSNFIKVEKQVPSVEEQIAIANFLSSYDEKVSIQKKRIDTLEKRKKGLYQQIFSQDMRFERENGTQYKEWFDTKIGSITKPIVIKNKNGTFPVYSVNNQTGFVPQTEQFDDREVASKDKSNYKVVSYRQFAYNPSRINVGSIAYLKDDIQVIISPLYVVFECDESKILCEFLEAFLKTDEFKRERQINTVGSVRDSLSYDGLAEISIRLPSIEEQKRIIDFLLAIDNQIAIEKKRLESMLTIKKGILQQMFCEE